MKCEVNGTVKNRKELRRIDPRCVTDSAAVLMLKRPLFVLDGQFTRPRFTVILDVMIEGDGRDAVVSERSYMSLWQSGSRRQPSVRFWIRKVGEKCWVFRAFPAGDKRSMAALKKSNPLRLLPRDLSTTLEWRRKYKEVWSKDTLMSRDK